MSGRGEAAEQRNVGSWFEETRRTEKEGCESIEIDYLKVKISLVLPSRRSKEPHSRMQSETVEMKRRAQYTSSGGNVDPAKSDNRKVEVEGKRGKRDERKKESVWPERKRQPETTTATRRKIISHFDASFPHRTDHQRQPSMFAAALALLALMLAVLGASRLRRIFGDVVYGPRRRYGYFSLERAAYSYAQYAQLALADVQDMRTSYVRLTRAHKRIGYDIAYPTKLNRLEETTHRNAVVTQAVAALAHREFPSLDARDADSGDLARIRETLKHFVRDWSLEGEEERTAIFQPILRALSVTPPDRRADLHVLVPGAGLGRLAWEISQLGGSRLCVPRSPPSHCRCRLPHHGERAVVLHDPGLPLPGISVYDARTESAHRISVCLLVLTSADQRRAIPPSILPRRGPPSWRHSPAL